MGSWIFVGFIGKLGLIRQNLDGCRLPLLGILTFGGDVDVVREEEK